MTYLTHSKKNRKQQTAILKKNKNDNVKTICKNFMW